MVHATFIAYDRSVSKYDVPSSEKKTTFIKSKSNYEMILDKGLNYDGSCTSLHHPNPTLYLFQIKYVLFYNGYI